MMGDKNYIEELEKALIFMCGVYVKAKESVEIRVDGDGNSDKRTVDLYFHFPMIQGTNNVLAVERIASLRDGTLKKSNNMSMMEIFERMHKGRITEKEYENMIKEVVEKEVNR